MPQIDIVETLKAAREGGASQEDIAVFLASITGDDLEREFNSEARRLGAKFNPDEFMKRRAVELAGKATTMAEKERYLSEEASKGILRIIDPTFITGFETTVDVPAPVGQMAIGAGKAAQEYVLGAQQLYQQTLGTPEAAEEVRQQAKAEEVAYQELADQSAWPTVGYVGGSIGAGAPLSLIPGGTGAIATNRPAQAQGFIRSVIPAAKSAAETLWQSRTARGAAIGAGEAMLHPAIEESPYSVQKFEHGLVGAGAGAAFPVVESLWNKRPIKSTLQYLANRAARRGQNVEGRELSIIVDNLLTPGEEIGQTSGGSILIGLENLARQYATARDKVLYHDRKLASVIKEKVLDPFVSLIYSGDVSDFRVGTQLQEMTRRAIESLKTSQKMQARVDYGLVNKIANETNFQLTPTNYINTLKDIISEYSGAASGTDRARVLAQAQRWLDEAVGTTKGVPGRPQDVQRSVVTGQPVTRPTPLEPTPPIPASGTTQRIDVISGKPMKQPPLAERQAFPNLNTMDLLQDTQSITGQLRGGPGGQPIDVRTGKPVMGETPVVSQQAQGMPGGPRIDPVTGKVVPNRLTISQAQSRRSQLGEGARGDANVFQDINPRLDRTISTRLFAAINKDMEDSAQKTGGELLEAFTRANNNYKKYADTMKAVEASALGKVLGDDVAENLFTEGFNEKTAEEVLGILRNQSDSSLKIVAKVLKNQDGGEEMLQQLRANWIADTIQNKQQITGEMRAAGIDWNYSTLIDALPTKGQMLALGAGPEELDRLSRNIKLLSLTLQRFGFNSSQSQTQGEVSNLFGAIFSGSKRAAGVVAGKIIGLDAVADMMMSQQASDTLKLLKNPSVTAVTVERTLAKLVQDWASQEPQDLPPKLQNMTEEQ